ncbi:MAG: hypothetical protein KDD01_04820 [Phaeodactylibacter sp.]|nr:hypothetical protein [Phaeodactylibacter sp.]MCB0612465.1 hypothetical protein [Phaeodactylibacter sp.]MCB9304585.1 hypothetical protein [Lewinellaceae bacterium]
MARKFEPLFSIDILNDYYEDGRSRDFILSPTPDCRQALAGHSLLFRQSAGGGAVYFTRIVPQDEILRRISALTRFRFFLQLKEPGLVNYTSLPANGEALPGKKLFYLTNIKRDTGAIDEGLGPEGELPLSRQPGLSDEDRIGYIPPISRIPLTPGKFGEMKVFRTLPGPGKTKVLESNIEEAARSLSVDLSQSPPGWYELQLLPRGRDAKIMELYADPAWLPRTPFGIIEIFKDKTTDYTHPAHYTLRLNRRKGRWSYIVIRASTAEMKPPPAYEMEVLYDPANHENPDVYPEEIPFGKVDTADQTETEKQLIQKFEPKQAELFRSGPELPFYERKLKGLKLKKIKAGGQELILTDNLPNPSARKREMQVFVNI